MADLNDGSYVQVQLGISNFGLGEGNGACRVLVVVPGQRVWTAAVTLSSNEWLFTRDPINSLIFGPCQATAREAGCGQARPRSLSRPIERRSSGRLNAAQLCG